MIVQIKNRKEENSTELWINGEFQSSWTLLEFTDGSLRRIIESMICDGIKFGERKKAEDIRIALGLK